MKQHIELIVVVSYSSRKCTETISLIVFQFAGQKMSSSSAALVS